MIQLSIVIPAYQCASTIRRCLDKILQTAYQDQYEVIVVNDGSRDETLAILKEYAETYQQLIVIDQPNQGVSAARNAGLMRASGQYIAFVDSDDYTEPDFVKSLLEFIGEPADLIVFNSDTVNSSGKREAVNCSSQYVDLDFEDIYRLVLRQQLNQPWGKLFRTSIVRENNVLFRKEVSIGEDLAFLMEYYHYISTVRYEHKILYHYVNSEGSLSHAGMTEKRVHEFMKAYQVQERLLRDPSNNKPLLMRSYINSIFRTVMLSGNAFYNISVWKCAYDRESLLDEVFHAKYDIKTDLKKTICNVLMR